MSHLIKKIKQFDQTIFDSIIMKSNDKWQNLKYNHIKY